MTELSEGERERIRAEREERRAEEAAQRAAAAAQTLRESEDWAYRPPIFGSMAEMNERFVYAKDIDAVVDRLTEDEYLCILTKDGFCTAFGSSRVIINDRQAVLPKLWLTDRERQTVDRITFSPADPFPFYRRGDARYYNRCRPSPFANRPYMEDCEQRSQPIIDHFKFICCEDERHFKILKQFIAFSIQHPGVRINWMMLFVTPKDGVGRGFIFRLLETLFPHQVVAKGTLSDVFDAQFTEFMSSARYLCFEEVVERDSSRTKSKINALITDTEITINDKNVKKFKLPNVSVKMGASNDLAALPLSPTDRRVYVIKNPSSFHKDGRDYYTKLYDLLKDEEMMTAFYQAMLQVDISDFDHAGRAPESEATKAMAAQATPVYLEYAREIHDKWPTRVIRAKVFSAYMSSGGLYGKSDGNSDEDKVSAWRLRRSVNEINAQYAKLRIRFKDVSGSHIFDDVIILNSGEHMLEKRIYDDLRNEALKGEELWRLHLAKESEDEQF